MIVRREALRGWLAATAVLAFACISPDARAFAPPAPAGRSPAPADEAGGGQQAEATESRYRGTIDVRGQELEFELVITRRGQEVSGTLSIPAQGIARADIRQLRAEGERLAFTFAPEGTPRELLAEFDLAFADASRTRAAGTLRQAGTEYAVKIEALAAGESVGPHRPQHPKPPLPYTAQEVLVTSSDGAVLAGTLTIPQEARFGPGPHPAAVLLTGSGPQDRDESILGHRPFAVIADDLTRRGVAVLRLDDRGVGGSRSPEGKAGQETIDDYANDAAAAVAMLRSRPGIDGRRVGVIGHSEGAGVGAMLGARDPGLAFVVLLAGTAVPGRQVLLEQAAAILLAAGAPAERVAAIRRVQERVIELAEAGAAEGELSAAIEQLVRAQTNLPPDAPLTPEQARFVSTAVGQQAAFMSSPWVKRFLAHDPAEDLEKVTAPVLALAGSLDLQVLPAQNLAPMRAALGRSGNADITVFELPGLNHLFQSAKTGHPGEYATIQETFAPKALELMGLWVTARVLPQPAP
ncbi:MAG: hypothetical protein C0513_06495 [Isosphaera sp.]|nr:hypothetical protein [Isosphaera sp.]